MESRTPRLVSFILPKLIRAFVVLLVLVVLFLGIALLPGKLEGGVYSHGISCMCDSLHFMDYREGRMIVYGTEHPPAEIWARYENGSDNVTTIYWLPLKEEEPETILARAYPHLLITRFVYAEDGATEWAWRRPKIGKVAKALKEQPIRSFKLLPDKTLVTTYYDGALNGVRTEVKPPKAQRKAHEAIKSKANEK